MQKVTYYPPSKEAIQQYARQACEARAAQLDDPSLTHYQIVNGLANYVSLLGKITADQMNRDLEVKTNNEL